MPGEDRDSVIIVVSPIGTVARRRRQVFRNTGHPAAALRPPGAAPPA